MFEIKTGKEGRIMLLGRFDASRVQEARMVFDKVDATLLWTSADSPTFRAAVSGNSSAFPMCPCNSIERAGDGCAGGCASISKRPSSQEQEPPGDRAVRCGEVTEV